jgi:hypothetical protein
MELFTHIVRQQIVPDLKQPSGGVGDTLFDPHSDQQRTPGMIPLHVRFATLTAFDIRVLMAVRIAVAKRLGQQRTARRMCCHDRAPVL